MDRADMINSLALAMGVNTNTGFKKTKYDTKTGTIYCNGETISDNTITNAITYFENMQAKCNRSDVREFKTVSTYYAAAIEALKFFQENSRLNTLTSKTVM